MSYCGSIRWQGLYIVKREMTYSVFPAANKDRIPEFMKLIECTLSWSKNSLARVFLYSFEWQGLSIIKMSSLAISHFNWFSRRSLMKFSSLCLSSLMSEIY